MSIRRSRRRVRPLIAYLLALSLCLPIAASAGGVASAATTVNLTPVRQIGGPGHADVYPWGLATTLDGRILVTDYWNWRVVELNLDGTFNRQVVGPVFTGAAAHAAPYGVAVDPRNGDFWFGDVDSGATVDKYTSGGTFLLSAGGPSAGSGANRFNYPAYVAVTSVGNLVVADSRDHNLVVAGPDGRELFQFSSRGSGAGQVNTPRGVAICHRCDSTTSDLLFVADANNRRVDVFRLQIGGTTSSSATFVRSFGRSGSGPGQFGGDMRGIAVDERNGWVYVVDAATGFVSKFTLTGTYLLRFGGIGFAPGQFVGGGRGVTVDPDGNVWVADLPDFGAQKFTPTGQFLLRSDTDPPPPGGFNTPTGVGVDAAGNVFVCDQRNWRIQEFDAAGAYVREWGYRGGGAFGLNYARGLAVDPTSGAVVVADTDNVAVKKYSNTGAFLWSASGHKAFQLDVGPDGRVYVADWQVDRVKVLSGSTGALLAQFGSSGTGNGQFLNARGIAVDPVDGSIWVSDGSRRNVQHFTNGGAFLGAFGASGAGALNLPGDVEVDADFVYVADSGAGAVKVWRKNGTYVGSFSGAGSAFGALRVPWGMDLAAGHLYVAEQNGERVLDFAVNAS
jgi:DNA-binding beta-propeller fold protein YncE